MILPIIGQGGRRASRAGGGARGEVAPAIVLGSIGLRLAAGGRAGGAGLVEPGELVGLAAVTVEVLVGPCAVVGTLPQLAQVRVDVAVAVAGPGQAVARPTATGATACRRGCPRVARPHQPIVLVVAERFGLAAPRIGGVRHGCLRGGQTGHVAGGIVGTRLTEDRATAALPTRARTQRAQVGVVAELVSGQRGRAVASQEVDAGELRVGAVAERRQVGGSRAVVAKPVQAARAVIDVGEGVALARRGGIRRGGGELVGVVVGERLLEGRERREGEAAAGRRELQSLGDQAPTLVVLPVLGDLALRVVRVRKVVDGEALGQPPFGVIGATPT